MSRFVKTAVVAFKNSWKRLLDVGR